MSETALEVVNQVTEISAEPELAETQTIETPLIEAPINEVKEVEEIQEA